MDIFTMDALVYVVVDHTANYTLGVSETQLIRRVHGDERVPSSVGDTEVRAAIAIAFAQGLIKTDGPSGDGSPWYRRLVVTAPGGVYVRESWSES